MGVLGKNNWFLRASGTPSPAAAAIVHPSPHEEHAMRWHTPKSKSEVSCGFAGSQVFCFSSQKWRKVLKTLGFSGVPRSGTLFEKNFWFSVVPCGCFVYQLVWENVLSLYLDKGVSFWGVFWEKTVQAREFFQQSHAVCACEDSIRSTARPQPKRISHSLTATCGAKKRHVFSDFLKIFFGVLFLSGQHERLSLMSASLQNG